MSVTFWTLALIALCSAYVVSSDKNVICYYGTWATYRWGNGKFDVGNVNPFLCTHLVYSFVGIDYQGNVVSLDSWLDYPDGKDNFGKFNALKQQNPELKTLLAVGGWNEGSAKYSNMAADANIRKNFIKSALNMILTYGFDGFDLDWEYPARRDSIYGATDIDNFSTLVKELKEEFNKYGLLLTAAVSSVPASASLSYDIPVISQYLDLIHLMSYDLYGAWDPVTGHNAPLHKGEGDELAAKADIYSVDVAVEYWLNQGCPPEKLALGVPFYGRTFTLTNANVNGVRAPASGAGIAGPYTVEAGIIGYNEFCELQKSQSWELRFDELARVPYAVQGVNWVSYDDPNSITEKIKWAEQYNITSVIFWSIETDDFKGICGEDFPLLRAINRALGRYVEGDEVETTDATTLAPTTVSTTAESTTAQPSSSSSTAAPETEATSGITTTDATTLSASDITTHTTPNAVLDTTTESVQETSLCSSEGIVANPNDCSSFFMCLRDAAGQFYTVTFACPTNLLFNPAYSNCDYAYNVNCSV